MKYHKISRHPETIGGYYRWISLDVWNLYVKNNVIPPPTRELKDHTPSMKVTQLQAPGNAAPPQRQAHRWSLTVTCLFCAWLFMVAYAATGSQLFLVHRSESGREGDGQSLIQSHLLDAKPLLTIKTIIFHHPQRSQSKQLDRIIKRHSNYGFTFP